MGSYLFLAYGEGVFFGGVAIRFGRRISGGEGVRSRLLGREIVSKGIYFRLSLRSNVEIWIFSFFIALGLSFFTTVVISYRVCGLL